ncbi:ScbA/BarX family gamma-butyrolactone biosynthesis protein [Streptomyces sp. NRAIS4]
MSVSTFLIDHAIPDARTADYDTATRKRAAASRYAWLTTTVPRELVHRAGIAEVMLTDWARVDDCHFTVAAQLPRRHGFFATVDGCHDSLLIAETIRQAGILLSHTEFGVPLGHQFLMWDLTIGIEPERMLVEDTPASLDISISCMDIKRRGSNLAGFHYEAVIRRDGHVAATGSATFTCTSPEVYARLRAGRIGDDAPAPLQLTSPIAPHDVGRASPTDVVLSPAREQDCWQLRVDTRHPVLFDHPVDHVPGMVLLEAARQATAAALGHTCLPVGMTTTFSRYAELDTACSIEARVLPPHANGEEHVIVTGRQNGQLVFTSDVTVAPAVA